jgi:serine/threonine-protein kinase
MTMELVRGSSLARFLNAPVIAGAASSGTVAAIAAKVADALHYAHGRGVVHRDVKPDNILIDADGEPKIADLGIALVSGMEDDSAGRVLGTPQYMSPEQARGESVGPAGDLYSLGASLYHVLAGGPVFDGDDPAEVMARQVRETPVPLAQRNPDVSPALAAIVDRLLAKDPSRRFASAAEARDAFLTVLERERGSETVAMRHFPNRDETGKLAGWRQTGYAGLAILLVLALAAAWWLYRKYPPFSVFPLDKTEAQP